MIRTLIAVAIAALATAAATAQAPEPQPQEGPNTMRIQMTTEQMAQCKAEGGCAVFSGRRLGELVKEAVDKALQRCGRSA